MENEEKVELTEEKTLDSEEVKEETKVEPEDTKEENTEVLDEVKEEVTPVVAEEIKEEVTPVVSEEVKEEVTPVVTEEVKVETKKKGNGFFILFVCIMTGVIVYLAMNVGDKAGKVVDPEVNTNKESNVTSNVESNVTSNVESNSNVISNVVSNSNVTSNVESNTTSNTTTSVTGKYTLEACYEDNKKVASNEIFGSAIKEGNSFELKADGKYILYAGVTLNEEGTYTLDSTGKKATFKTSVGTLVGKIENNQITITLGKEYNISEKTVVLVFSK